MCTPTKKRVFAEPPIASSNLNHRLKDTDFNPIQAGGGRLALPPL